jgi:hypothetical protein
MNTSLLINYYFIYFRRKVKGSMNFLISTQQNDMHLFEAKKLEVSRLPISIPISPGREKRIGSVGPMKRGSASSFPQGKLHSSPEGISPFPAPRVARVPGGITTALT